MSILTSQTSKRSEKAQTSQDVAMCDFVVASYLGRKRTDTTLRITGAETMILGAGNTTTLCCLYGLKAGCADRSFVLHPTRYHRPWRRKL